MKFAILRVFITMFLVQLFFGFPIGGIISVFPTVPKWAIFLISILTIPTVCYFIYTKYIDKAVHIGEQPNFIQRNKKSIALGVVLGAVMFGVSSSYAFDSDLIIDNGTIKPVKVEYYTRTKEFNTIEIPSGSFQTITLPLGENIVVMNGKKKNILMGKRGGYYIYNVDGVNNYLLAEIEYGSNATYPKEKQNFYSTVFFKVQADYLFEAPETIVTKRTSSKKKTVLYRLNNTSK
ncbi:MAG: hypothetical protein KAX53_01685 [Saprospiraceae bacterium]|nr:hypothetical protein [Saprospiraceae bacterium]